MAGTTLGSGRGSQHPRWIGRILQLFSGKCISLDGKPYLTRYYLIGDGSGRGYELYLHFIQREDPYRWLHNHPWRWFVSVVLRGYYEQQELRPHIEETRRCVRIRFFSFFRNAGRYHAISRVPADGVWTLVLVPPKSKSEPHWGYWDEDRKVHIPEDGEESSRCVTQRFGHNHSFHS